MKIKVASYTYPVLTGQFRIDGYSCGCDYTMDPVYGSTKEAMTDLLKAAAHDVGVCLPYSKYKIWNEVTGEIVYTFERDNTGLFRVRHVKRALTIEKNVIADMAGMGYPADTRRLSGLLNLLDTFIA